MIASCEQLGIYTVSKSGQDIRVDSPNILKYRDEWTRKKSKTPEQLRSKEQIQNTDTESDIELKLRSSCPGSVEPDAQSQKNPIPKPQRKPPEPIPENSDAYRLAAYMRDTLKANVPTLKEPNIQAWAHEFDRALRNDERMKDARFVALVIKWACSDNFWRANIQSPGKLREKFDQLTAKMESEAARARASPQFGGEWKSPAQRQLESNQAAAAAFVAGNY
jgi:hypothetical protein